MTTQDPIPTEDDDGSKGLRVLNAPSQPRARPDGRYVGKPFF